MMTQTTVSAEQTPNVPASAAHHKDARPAWMEVLAHFDPKYGGLSSAVPALSSAIADSGRRHIQLTGFCRPGEYYAPQIGPRVHLNHLPLSKMPWMPVAQQALRFRKLVQASAGVHIHGLWQQSSAVSARCAKQLGRPYVVSAHGMLDRWAVANKGLKKRLYLQLIECRVLQGASCLHALTQAEAEDYRRLGLTNPIAVIPNGVDIPTSLDPASFLETFPQLRGKRLLLFLGRLHFKKGLDILCKAWSTLAPHEDHHLVLAGPDFEGTRIRIEDLVDSLGMRSRVTFTGMLQSQLKWSAFAASEAFVLPSYSEGLSVSVLEAMGCGLPVVISDHCNLPEVAEHGCGWVIPAETDALRDTLDELLSAPSQTLTRIGQNGRFLVGERYSWNTVGRHMDALYTWLEGGGIPSSIDLQWHAGKQS